MEQGIYNAVWKSATIFTKFPSDLKNFENSLASVCVTFEHLDKFKKSQGDGQKFLEKLLKESFCTTTCFLLCQRYVCKEKSTCKLVCRAYCLMKSVIQDELASGTFLHAKAQALSIKSFTDNLYSPSESRFNCFLTLHTKQKRSSN